MPKTGLLHCTPKSLRDLKIEDMAERIDESRQWQHGQAYSCWETNRARSSASSLAIENTSAYPGEHLQGSDAVPDLGRDIGSAADYPIADATPRTPPAINGWFSRLVEVIACVGTIAPLSLSVACRGTDQSRCQSLGESHVHPTTIWTRDKP
jgi:hypothetical protein